ncbi:MAG: DsbA family protein [Hyphomicrobiaceae bacterium]|nr:DsbA family protein [Hyphomicrobiaceae bacterium]
MGTKKLLHFMAIGFAGLFVVSCSDDEPPKMAESKPAIVGQQTDKISGVAKNGAAKAVADNMVSASGFSSAQEKAIGELVRKTLLAKPEILQEAFAALEKRDKEEQARRKTSALSGSAETLFRSKLSPTAGNPKGDVTIVEFFDYNCPYCRKAFKDLETVMGQDDKLRVVFKEYPIFGGASLVAAKAALAARNQGKYFQFHKSLLEADSRITKDTVFRKAEQLGLDMVRLKKDMESSEVAASIAETKQLADRLGIRGTPAFYVGDKYIGGAPRDLVKILKDHASDIRKNGCKYC